MGRRTSTASASVGRGGTFRVRLSSDLPWRHASRGTPAARWGWGAARRPGTHGHAPGSGCPGGPDQAGRPRSPLLPAKRPSPDHLRDMRTARHPYRTCFPGCASAHACRCAVLPVPSRHAAATAAPARLPHTHTSLPSAGEGPRRGTGAAPAGLPPLPASATGGRGARGGVGGPPEPLALEHAPMNGAARHCWWGLLRATTRGRSCRAHGHQRHTAAHSATTANVGACAGMARAPNPARSAQCTSPVPCTHPRSMPTPLPAPQRLINGGGGMHRRTSKRATPCAAPQQAPVPLPLQPTSPLRTFNYPNCPPLGARSHSVGARAAATPPRVGVRRSIAAPCPCPNGECV